VWPKHLLDSGVGDGRLRQHFAALKFLYKKTLAQPEAVEFLSCRGKAGPLLDILSAAEVERTLTAVRRLRFRMLFTTGSAPSAQSCAAQHRTQDDHPVPRFHRNMENGYGGLAKRAASPRRVKNSSKEGATMVESSNSGERPCTTAPSGETQLV